jgi:DNA uptake protein ComE-like DNA-binding protein
VSLAINFSDSMIMEYRAAENALAARQADQAIEGARRYVTLLLTNNPTPGQPLDPTTYEAEKVPVGDAAFWLIGRSTVLNPPSGVATYGLVDEASKLNLNSATADMLAALPGMTPDFAASIYNWSHATTDVAPGGATAQNYEMLDTPYEPKNSPFETVEELRLVFQPDSSQSNFPLLLGKDTNLNGILEPSEIQGTASNRGTTSMMQGVVADIPDYGIFEYVTIYSREPNSTTSTVNLATAPTATGNPIEGPLTTILQTANVSPDHVTSAIAALPAQSLLEFYMKSGMTAAEFALVESQLTANTGTSIVGRVNVNTASAAVLECLTGMTQALAEQLVNTRQNQTLDQLASIAWVAGVITDQTVAQQVGPLITTHSYQFSADVAAVGHNGRGFRRNLFVIDTSSLTPTVIYSRDRTRCGWPLGNDVREEYQSQEKP